MDVPSLPTNLDEYSNTTITNPIWRPLLIFMFVPFAIGIFFAVVGPIIQAISWCCNCCCRCVDTKHEKTTDKASIRKLQFSFVLFTVVCFAGCALGFSFAPKIVTGADQLSNVYDEFFGGVGSILNQVVSTLDDIAPTINDQSTSINSFISGLNVFNVPIDNIGGTLNNLTTQVQTVQSGLTVATSNLTQVQSLLAKVTTTASLYGLSANIPQSSAIPNISGTVSSNVNNALNSLSSSQNTVNSMHSEVLNAISSVNAKVTPALDAAISTVNSSLVPVESQIHDVQTSIKDNKKTGDDIMVYFRAISAYVKIGAWFTYGVAALVAIIGVIFVVFLKKHRAASCLMVVFWIGTFLFFLLFSAEILGGQAVAIYCRNYTPFLEVTVPNSASSDIVKKVPQIVMCGGNGNIFNILGLVNKFNLTSQIDLSQITSQSYLLDRSTDVANAQATLLQATSSLDGISIDTANITTAIAQLQNVSTLCSDIRNFDSPIPPNAKISDSDISTANTALANLNNVLAAGFTYDGASGCQGNIDNAFFGCGTNGCPAGTAIASLAMAYFVVTPSWTFGNPIDKCPFSGIPAGPQSADFLSNYTNVYPVAKVTYVASTTQQQVDTMISDLQGVADFSQSVSNLVTSTAPSDINYINSQLSQINMISTEAMQNLSTTVTTMTNNIDSFVTGLLSLGNCKWFGDTFQDFNHAMCQEYGPGLRLMSAGHVLIAVPAFACFFIAFVASRRFRNMGDRISSNYYTAYSELQNTKKNPYV